MDHLCASHLARHGVDEPARRPEARQESHGVPQHLAERELTGGNGLVEMGTFVAILLGEIVGEIQWAVN